MPEILGRLRTPRLPGAPSAPVAGEVYFDTTTNILYWWNGTTWVASGAVSGTATVYDTDQIGTIKAFSGAIIPTNWMLADGRSLLRADYPQLFAAIGTTYGSVDGTHFNLPDLRGKFIYGANSSSTQGATDGASTHTLDLTQIPGHNHGGATAGADRSLATTSGAADRALGTNTTGAHKHFPTTVGQFYATTSLALYNPGSGGTGRYLVTGGEDMTNAGDHAHTVTDHLHSVPGVDHLHGISTAGGGLSHNNMPPYIEIAQIIKIAGVTVDSGAALTGATGAKGDPGPWRGAWSATNSYAVGESVSYFDGQVTGTYRRKVAGTTAGTPKADTTNWEIVASGGSIGVNGTPGTVPVYEQPGAPLDTTVGAIWIDTDDVAPIFVGLPLVASLPSNPVDGQEIHYLADATNGIVWHLRYRAASTSAYKWEFVGGSELLAVGSGANQNFTASLVNISCALAVPLAGTYDVNGRCQFAGGYEHNLYANGVGVSLTIGYWNTTSGSPNEIMNARDRLTLTTGTLSLAIIGTGGGFAVQTSARLWLKPVRVG